MAIAKWGGAAKLLDDVDPDRVCDATGELDEMLVVSGKWHRDADAALAAIVKQLPKVEVELGRVLLLIADIIAGDHRGLLEPKTKRPPKKVVAVADEHFNELEELARSKDGTARGGFALIAATLPTLAERSRATLIALSNDKDPIVRMSAVLALAAVGREAALAAVAKRAKDRVAGVRGAAALVELVLSPNLSLADRSDALAGWLGFQRPVKGTNFLWFSEYRGTDVVAPLLALAERRKETDTLLELMLNHPPAGAIKSASELVVSLGGFEKFGTEHVGYVALPDELNAKQRKIAERLVDSDLIPTGAYGLPAPGITRRRWMGLAPPGPSDKMVEVKHGRKKYRGPFWRVAQDIYRDDGAMLYVMPPCLESELNGLERWHMLIERSARNYGGSHFSPSLVEPMVQEVKGHPKLRQRGEQIVTELLRRFRPARGIGRVHDAIVFDSLDGAGHALLFLPFVNGKEVWPEAWDDLIQPVCEDGMIHVAAALPRKRRDALVGEWLALYARPNRPGQLLDTIARVVATDPHPKLMAKIDKFAKGLPENVGRRLLRDIADEIDDLNDTD